MWYNLEQKSICHKHAKEEYSILELTILTLKPWETFGCLQNITYALIKDKHSYLWDCNDTKREYNILNYPERTLTNVWTM